MENLYEKKRICGRKRKEVRVRGKSKKENDKNLQSRQKNSPIRMTGGWMKRILQMVSMFDPDEAEELCKGRQRLTRRPMVTGYEALESTRCPQTEGVN